MDTALIFNPIVTPIAVAIIGSLAVLVALWLARQSIAAALGQARQRIFTRQGLFWAVNLVFMGVSVLHAGVFFGIASTGPAELLGFAVSFFLDLVTVILMQAMLESRYRGEDGRARQFLLFICVCCGTSTFANLAISLNDFDAAKMLPHVPTWVQVAAPWVLASFPLFVIMMSIAAEMIINLRPLESLDTEEYEADELKRITILQIRNTYLAKQAEEELRILEIRAATKANKERYKPVLSWPFRKPESVDIDALKAQLTSDYTAQIKALQEQLQAALNGREDEISSVFKRPLSLDEYRFKENHATDGTGALKSDAEAEACAYVSPVINATVPSPQAEPALPASPVKNGIKTAESIAKQWHDGLVKSVSVDDIIRDTGLSRQKVAAAKHRFSRVGRNGDLYRTASVVAWLKQAL